jgi:hypothetical protein
MPITSQSAHGEDILKQFKPSSNENMNIINGIFGSNGGGFSGFPSSAGASETERERRIKLRELERKKRMEGVTGGDYGQLDT